MRNILPQTGSQKSKQTWRNWRHFQKSKQLSSKMARYESLNLYMQLLISDEEESDI